MAANNAGVIQDQEVQLTVAVPVEQGCFVATGYGLARLVHGWNGRVEDLTFAVFDPQVNEYATLWSDTGDVQHAVAVEIRGSGIRSDNRFARSVVDLDGRADGGALAGTGIAVQPQSAHSGLDE